MDIQKLDAQIYKAGYMKRAYIYYLFLGCFTFVGLVISILVLIFSESLLIQSLTIIVFTFFRMQIAFLGHDLTHNQVFKSKKRNKFFGYIVWSLMSGVSQDYWIDKHVRHHENTNQHGQDPDLEIPFLFSKEHIHGSNWFLNKFIFPYQHILFFFSMPFVYLTFVYESYNHAFTARKNTSVYEICSITLNVISVFVLLIYVQGFALGFLFALIHFCLAGIYMFISFSPNHLGKEVIAADEKYQRVFQITTSRNLFPSFVGTFIFGGLDYQIEHHLYPTMPRNNYKKVGPIVKDFCQKHDINYSQTSFLGSMKEIYVALKEYKK